MSFKEYIFGLIAFLIVVLVPSVAQASVTHVNMGEADQIDVHKDWEVAFNEGVRIVESSITDANIVVKDNEGNNVDIPDPYVKEDGRVIVVPAPEEGYKGGHTYKLYVGKTIAFESGKEMEDRYMKTFQTEWEILDPPSPGDDIVSYGTVTSDTLNIRQYPGEEADSVGSFKEGDRVDIYGFDGYWAKILYNGEPAYVHKTYMKLRAMTGGVLQDQIIIIDPGHGDGDPGATANGGQEKEINLDVSKRIHERLKEMGANSIMTREDDSFLALSERVEFADENFYDMFVSIHTNALPGSSANGTETFCHGGKASNQEEGCLLAEKIHEQIVAKTKINDRGVKVSTPGTWNDFHVIRNTTTPSVLVELGFLTHSADAEKLLSDHYRDLYADAVAEGIKNYYLAEIK
ncbi:N-acetylmuramoyl-L-alanine amidase [Halobacillus litoralis]|uniref:N-acetylmuramoyl-L-alanine amidase n=1 Tax=Halobacillus litoralis TaxID=45668 RepID=UPI001CD4FD83|nr:N-acetylmuramoyl-L-alanine amidase [Halobacillus litoralis]MCA0971553.1 N-acetylmuramoyl-L-alanine amidase [Halobacillus litoralis]